MKFFAGLVLSLSLVWAQTCAPRAVLRPADAVSGTLDENNCRLSEGTYYAEYALTLPTRGRLQLSGVSSSFDLALTLRSADGRALSTGATIAQPVERGAYVAVVSAATPDQAGDFTLASAFVPEPGTLCRDFPSVGLNQAVTGRLAGGGCRLPDGSAYDGYLLATFGSGTLNIAMDSGDFTPYAILRDDQGHLLGAGDTISLSVDGDQSYAILASGADPGATGQYHLSLSFTPADDETCRSLKTFRDAGSDQGTISDASCTFTADGADSSSRYNYYDVQVPQPGVAEFRLSSPTLYPYLLLLDAGGAPVASDGWSGGPGLAVVRQQLSPGRYVLQAFGGGPPTGDYTLQYTFRPGLPETCPVLSLAPNTPVQGTLDAASCRTRDGISDVYQIEMPSAGTLDLDMQSSDFVPMLAIRDARDNRIVIDNNNGGYTDSHLTADLPAGSYSVVAGTWGSPGAYTLSLQVAAHDPVPCANVRTVDPGSAYQGVFSGTSCRGPNGQPADYYQITTPADGTLAAVMTSPVIDSFLTLLGPDGNVLRWDDNSYGAGDAIWIQFLPGQTYRIAAQAADAVRSGYYRLDVLFSPNNGKPGCAPRSTLGIGDSAAGNLDFTSCQYVDDTFADIYQLNLADTTAVDIRLDSQDFDAYLQILDAKGNVVAEDDNSGEGTNARVFSSFDPGTYYVIAKPFGDYTSAGSYLLAVNPAQ